MAEHMSVRPILDSHWKNYGGGFVDDTLWTVESTKYTWVQQIIGLLWACAGISIGAIIVRSIDLYRRSPSATPQLGRDSSSFDSERGSSSGGRPNDNASLVPTDSTPLLRTGRSVTDNGSIVQEDSSHERSSCTSELGFNLALRPRFVRWLKKGVCFALALAFSAGASVYTSSNASSVGLLDSKHCGSYALQDVDNNIDRIKDNIIQAEKERRAGRYARDCYTKRDTIVKDSETEPRSIDPDRCKFFNTQSISYDIHLDQPCPFKDPNICAESHNAVEFVTFNVSASDLGINSPKLPFFRRKAVCAPLTMDSHYVDPSGQYPVNYRFGPLRHSNVTFTQWVDPFEFYISAYRVSALEHTPWDEVSSWIPIDELTPQVANLNPKRAYTTAIFVEACRILYAGACDDYIFPAQHLYHDSSMYYNLDRRARPLACVDWLDVCQSDGQCHQTWEESNPHEVEYEFVRAAMLESTMYSALEFRLGAALLAQDKIDDFRSQKLDGRQWILEAAALFETSLSRIQHDALDIAIGFGYEKLDSGLYYDQAPDWMIEEKQSMCRLYKFKLPPGYLNISYNAAITTIVILVALALLGIPTFWRRYESEGPIAKRGQHALVFEIFVSLFCQLSIYFKRKPWKTQAEATQVGSQTECVEPQSESRNRDADTNKPAHPTNGHPTSPHRQATTTTSSNQLSLTHQTAAQDEADTTPSQLQQQDSSVVSHSGSGTDGKDAQEQSVPVEPDVDSSSENEAFDPVSLTLPSNSVPPD